ncbi:hypothetical protein KFK09_022952 [Dendrobium nobile]|uniref:Uncharacterized protein n=1 Tax=Dendrobium nobile TaxID=94219 RepID=A0A8T3AKY2_DENNO|nr:hypothetical protein KFK09_022952 [Dendrobium nobile]
MRGKEDYSWLEAIDAPDDFYMRSGKYSGPPVKVFLQLSYSMLVHDSFKLSSSNNW